MKIGIIGGSGLEDLKILSDAREIFFDTPYGRPSSPLILGKINDIEVIIISRHGKNHAIPPTFVNNRANIWALKEQGCTHIIATTACGSLREEIGRGDFVILNQFIDFTRHRTITYFEEFNKGPKHTAMAKPFSEELREILIKTCKELDFACHEKGTIVTIEGPRFSTIAESNMFRSWGADVINMSTAPEAVLANELQIPYAVIAMSTDYDCWKQDESPVTWEMIENIFKQNAEKVKQLIIKTISKFSKSDSDFIKDKIRTIPDWPKPGIMFRDITTLLKEKEAMEKTIEIFYERYKDKQIDIIAGIEARGFIFGSLLAQKLNIPFVPIRKKGKLPAETISQEYELEYGIDSVEIHKDAIKQNSKVLIIDDLLATGGTATASCQLIEKLGGQVVECAFVIELENLKGRQKLQEKNFSMFSIVQFEGE